ncbi:MAG: polysaccharide biosynthesis protein [Firmicutes bacterium]|nr:polysaccharide biosynthesis protein [Bacillota bacterium]
MKKNSFIGGAMVATLGIVVTKAIGLLYVIPFYAIIGTQGGALYSYAYSIYAIFLSLSNSGIPVAVSKVVSEYNALGYHYTKEKAYKVASLLLIGLGFFFFLVLIICAPMIAKMILGNIQGGNTVEGVTLVIRIVATALLIVPIESATQGYLQGQKFMIEPSMANVIEQIVRVVVILVGSFLTLKVFHLSLESAVGVAVFGATVGALIAYFYLLSKIHKNRKKLHRHNIPLDAERKITTKEVFRKIIFYALPFVMIDVLNSAYGMVDTLTVVKTMTTLGYSAHVTETSIGVLTTWATKLNMIIAAVALGISTSLIPNLAASKAQKDHKDISRKINQALKALFFTTIPMAVGMSFLATPIWTIFYGYDSLSIHIFKLFIFQTISFSFSTVLINIAQSLSHPKLAMGSLLGSFLAKFILNTPMMYLFHNIGIPAYYAPIATTFLTQCCVAIFLLIQLRRNYQVRYFETLRVSLKTFFATGCMLAVLMIINLLVPTYVHGRGEAILITMLFAMIGGITYLFCAYQGKLVNNVFGKQFVMDMFSKLKRHRKLKKV